MTPYFKRCLKFSSAFHGVILLALVVSPFFFNWWQRRQEPREIVTFLSPADLLQPPPADEATPPDDAADEPPPPPPDEPDDIPEPITEKPKPTAPAATPVPTKPKEIQKGPRVQRPTPSAAKPKATSSAKPLTPQEIANRLARGLPVTGPGTPTTDDLPGWYYDLVRQTLYEAWAQPSGLSATPGNAVHATLRVGRSGNIISRRITRASGIASLDASVQAALDSVTRLDPLPAGARGDYKDITIVFELTGAF